MVILSVSVERFSVTRMRDFKKSIFLNFLIFHEVSETSVTVGLARVITVRIYAYICIRFLQKDSKILRAVFRNIDILNNPNNFCKIFINHFGQLRNVFHAK